MRILVLGASGRCGQWVVRLAAARGHDVTCAVRPATAYVSPEGVTVRRGEVLDAAFVDEIVPGHDVVVSCLGLRRRWISPWAKLLSPKDLLQRALGATTTAMKTHGVERLAVISAGGAGSSRARTSWPIRQMIRAGTMRKAYRDIETMERHLETTDLDWVAVRPVTLVNGDPTGRAGRIERYGLFSTVRRSDVADWIVRWVDGEVGADERTILLGKKGVSLDASPARRDTPVRE